MRAVVGRVLFFGLLLACRLGLDGVEQFVQILPVVDEAHALVDAGEAGRPVGLPGAALDADVGHGFLLGEAAFHGAASAVVRPIASCVVRTSWPPLLCVRAISLRAMACSSPALTWLSWYSCRSRAVRIASSS